MSENDDALSRARLSRRGGDNKAAADFFRMVVGPCSEPLLIVEYCEVLCGLGLQGDAINFIEQLDPQVLRNSPPLVARLACCYRESGRALLGAKIATDYLQVTTDALPLLMERVICLLWARRPQEALEAAERFHAIADNDFSCNLLIETLIDCCLFERIDELAVGRKLKADIVLKICSSLEQSGRSDRALQVLFARAADAGQVGDKADWLKLQEAVASAVIRRGLAACFPQVAQPPTKLNCELLLALFQQSVVPLSEIFDRFAVVLENARADDVELLAMFYRVGILPAAYSLWKSHGSSYLSKQRNEVLDFIRCCVRNKVWCLLEPQHDALAEIIVRPDTFSRSLRHTMRELLDHSEDQGARSLVGFHLGNLRLQMDGVSAAERSHFAKLAFGDDWETVLATADLVSSCTFLVKLDWSGIFSSDGETTSNRSAWEQASKSTNYWPISDAIRQRRISHRFVVDFIATDQERQSRPEWFKIVQYWNDDQPPAEIVNLIDSIRTVNSAIPHVLFSDTSVRDYVKLHKPELLRFWLDCPKPAFRADMFRILYLYNEGGLWLDADEQPVHPLSIIQPSLLNNLVLSTFGEYYGGYYANNDFVICPPGHPLAEVALNEMMRSVNILSSRSSGQIDYYHHFGPALWTRVISAALETNQVARGVILLSRRSKDYFFKTASLDYKSDPSKNWRN